MNNKTKIYLFNPYPGIGGADTTISRFIKSINLNKYEVEYITLNKDKILFNKKIKKTQISSNSTFLSFFQLIKIVKKDKNKKNILFHAIFCKCLDHNIYEANFRNKNIYL